jgi:hypothetical protein
MLRWRSSGQSSFVILSEAKNLGVPITRDASLTLSMTEGRSAERSTLSF